MPKYLLDSDVLIWVLRNRRDTVDLLQKLSGESSELLACSSLSVLEVWVGAKAGEQTETEQLFSALDIIPVDSATARTAAGLLSLRKRASPDEWIDAVIAATSLLFTFTLVTYNSRDYPYPEISMYPFH